MPELLTGGLRRGVLLGDFVDGDHGHFEADHLHARHRIAHKHQRKTQLVSFVHEHKHGEDRELKEKDECESW